MCAQCHCTFCMANPCLTDARRSIFFLVQSLACQESICSSCRSIAPINVNRREMKGFNLVSGPQGVHLN